MLDVADQALCFVLRCDADTTDAGINAIGERKIDNAEFATERHGGFGTPVCKLTQAAAPAASQYHRYRITRNLADITQARLSFHLIIVVRMTFYRFTVTLLQYLVFFRSEI